MKQYQVVVTNQRIIFGRLSLMGAVTETDAFTFKNIQRILMKKGLLAYQLKFVFYNGRMLRLDANHKAARAMKGFVLDEQMASYLRQAVAA
ncbi:MAG: hypothetical protein HKP58_14230 [Desulfatitalea sp.]|nr:hypothetical protein [Desulfatitalea sp.]